MDVRHFSSLLQQINVRPQLLFVTILLDKLGQKRRQTKSKSTRSVLARQSRLRRTNFVADLKTEPTPIQNRIHSGSKRPTPPKARVKHVQMRSDDQLNAYQIGVVAKGTHYVRVVAMFGSVSMQVVNGKQ
ncbi:hypothetical protein CR513_60279, partial [Mucuna pruriens]